MVRSKWQGRAPVLILEDELGVENVALLVGKDKSRSPSPPRPASFPLYPLSFDPRGLSNLLPSSLSVNQPSRYFNLYYIEDCCVVDESPRD